MGEVKEYMMAKELPQDLRNRLNEYYECKMQKKFFSEGKIMDTLSERLRTEMFLHFARKLIEQNYTLKTLPSTTLGILISYMKSETFLADDVVCAIGKPSEMVFFLSAGTIAVYNRNHLELDHLYDGQDFGLDGGKRTHTYKLFKTLLSEHSEVWTSYEKKWAQRQKRYEEVEIEMESGGETLLYELSRGALLEAPKTRLVIFDDLLETKNGERAYVLFEKRVNVFGISAAYLVLKQVRNRKKLERSIWMKEYFKTRDFHILKDLQGNDNILFRSFTRMSRNNFETLLEMVRPIIEKSNTRFKEAIPAEVRLAITLRFLATGDSVSSLMYHFGVSKQPISALVPAVLKAIIESLDHFIKIVSAKDYENHFFRNSDYILFEITNMDTKFLSLYSEAINNV
nr:unnamed protein product [Callosobruchus analis]